LYLTFFISSALTRTHVYSQYVCVCDIHAKLNIFSIILANTKFIMILLGQDHAVSMEAEKYAKSIILCLFAHGLIQCLNKFLQVQNTILPTMLILMVAVSLRFSICWVMVHKSRLGKRGVTIENCVLY